MFRLGAKVKSNNEMEHFKVKKPFKENFKFV